MIRLSVTLLLAVVVEGVATANLQLRDSGRMNPTATR